MCFRKAAVVVPLLQGLAKVQIVSHSRFTAKMEFDTSHLETSIPKFICGYSE